MKIPTHIFKSYDIRGLVDGELSEELATRVGKAAVALTGAKTVVVGQDMRETSPLFAEAVVRGVTSMGANVVRIGLCSTPMFNFAVGLEDAHELGIMVTASHNPIEYNGFKMAKHNVLPIGKGTGMEELRDLVIKNVFDEAEVPGTVSERADIAQLYMDRVFAEAGEIPSLKDLTVVVDAGNGMSGMLVEPMFDRLDCTVHAMYLEPDGSFPNHEANPLHEETLNDLKAKMQEVGADIGIAYDGDGDRVGFVDTNGVYVRGDIVASLFAKDILERYPNGTIFYDLRSSRVLKKTIEEAGGVAKMTEVGHANVKRHMLHEDGVFGAELSSHFFYKEFHNAEASEYTALLMLKKMVETGQTLADLVAPYQSAYATAKETNFRVRDRAEAIATIEERYAGEARERLDMDGITLYFDGWWFNLRQSNTEPVVRLTIEADDASVLEAKMNELTDILNALAV